MAATKYTLLDFLPFWYDRLQQWSLDGRLSVAAQEALLLDGELQALKDLVSQWSLGDFQAVPEIVMLSNADINGAMGAYPQSTGKIYLNADWLATATQEAVNAVLTEELGHYLDGLLNTVDTSGDEGECFSDLLLGGVLTDAQRAYLRTANDAGTMTVDGVILQAEFAVATALPSVSVVAIANGNEADGSPVVFQFERTGNISAALSVGYRLFGTAQAGSDYTGNRTDTISFASGSAIASLSLPTPPVSGKMSPL